MVTRKRLVILLLVLILALACNLPTATPGGTPSTEDAASPTVTPDAGPEAQPTPEPTATSEPPTPRPSPPPAVAPAPGYTLREERVINGYGIRLWDNAADTYDYDDMLTISAVGMADEVLETVFAIGPLTGSDLTGEGNPDLVVETYTGGAHCCSSTRLYDLGPQLRKLLETPLSNCGGSFEDLDGDGIYEFATCDDLFAYRYCAYAGSPMVRVVLQYRNGEAYVPASPDFAELYAEDIARDRPAAEDPAKGIAPSDWDGTPKCATLPVVLDYLYTDQPAEAWDVIDRLYPYADKRVFWAEVVKAVTASPLWVGTAPMPSVSLPEAYMLQLLTSCGADRQQIGFLQPGQDPCGPDVPWRDTSWLSSELYGLGLLSANETLLLTPEGCTTTCRLDVFNWDTETRVGSIRLNTTVGFPGAVYRVNGVESSRRYLRGDLTWVEITP